MESEYNNNLNGMVAIYAAGCLYKSMKDFRRFKM